MDYTEQQVSDFYDFLSMNIGSERDEMPHICKGYSGRSMYGKTCLGIISDNPVCDIAQLALAALDEADSFCDEERAEAFMRIVSSALTNARTDSMGRSTIVYFPGVDVPSDEMEVEDEDEDKDNE